MQFILALKNQNVLLAVMGVKVVLGVGGEVVAGQGRGFMTLCVLASPPHLPLHLPLPLPHSLPLN